MLSLRSPLGIAFVLSVALGACRESKPAPFLLEVDIRPGAAAPAGLTFSVNGEVTERIWEGAYTSLEDACASLEAQPLQIGCIDIDSSSCGVAELSGVCCWAPDVLNTAVVKGTVYVAFDGAGNMSVQEGLCEADNGSSTHEDGTGADAGTP